MLVINQLDSLPLLLCGNHGLPHGGGCGRGPSQQKRDTAPHTAHAGAGGLHTEADAIRQDGRRHPVGQTAAFGNGGKGEDAYRHGLCPEDGTRHAHDRPALRRPPRQQGEPLCQNNRGVLSKIRRAERHAVRFL